MRQLETIFLRVFFVLKLSMLYMLLSIIGCLIFGVSPANATILYLYHRYKGDAEKYTFREAWQYFKSVFIQSNSFLLFLFLSLFVLLYSSWWIIQCSTIPILLPILFLNGFGMICLISAYGLYLVFQIYYDFQLLLGLKLVVAGVFFNPSALVKWLLGSAICAGVGFRLPLVAAVFLPVVWLLFSYDVLQPVKEEVEKKSET